MTGRTNSTDFHVTMAMIVIWAYCGHVVTDNITMAEVRRSTSYHVCYYKMTYEQEPTTSRGHEHIARETRPCCTAFPPVLR